MAIKTSLLRERYEPIDVIGREESEVIRAVDHLHGRQVALKIRAVADDASRTHLLSGSASCSRFRRIPDFPLVREDFVDDRYVIAMDWIEGRDLQVLLDLQDRPGLDPALVIGYLEQAAEALEHFHTHDPPVVHGDVKPANPSSPPPAESSSSTSACRPRPPTTCAGPGPRLRGARGRRGSETDGGIRRVLVGRHRRRCSPARHPRWARRAGARSSRSASRRWSESCARTWPPTGAPRSIGGCVRRAAEAMVGRRPPAGTVTPPRRRQRHAATRRGGFGERARRRAPRAVPVTG